MNELEFGGVKRDASDAALGGFVGAVLAVADDGMAQRGKLHPDLILQSCQQSHAHQRSCAERALDGIAEFSSRCFAVFLRTQLLMHAFFPKKVDQGSLFSSEVSADHCQILADGSVGEKLFY